MSDDVNMSTLCTKEQLHWCYMALQSKFNEEKSKHTGFSSGKWFWPCVLDMMLRLVKGTAKLTLAVDWLDCLIGPGGLLLVVSHQFAVPNLVFWVGLEKSK
jgi:hypothetical protein